MDFEAVLALIDSGKVSPNTLIKAGDLIDEEHDQELIIIAANLADQ